MKTYQPFASMGTETPEVIALLGTGLSTPACPDKARRQAEILDIFRRGQVAVFSTRQGLVKKAREWTLNEEGDLIGFYTTGQVLDICWDSAEYQVTEEPPS